ncbi:hypothetical protein BAE44_0020872 [Dichanthelium oligosanthes]|uniref:Uncharacterized protein n=1 Tax=Dichanthelium oligosanthes TaxID=888268 RepID=A0A1E5UYZ1_9POAL|nr:hypothetical protein BAE44_0020872 [Dichanthelium oligosanthes]
MHEFMLHMSMSAKFITSLRDPQRSNYRDLFMDGRRPSPTLPTIEEAALRNLISLQLLSEDLGDLSGIEIRRHEHLQEIALDSEINQEAKTVWEDASKKHPKRPRVLYLKRVDPQGMGSMVKYVSCPRDRILRR